MKLNSKALFPFTVRDGLVMLFFLAAATLLCCVIRIFDSGNVYVSMIYLLAVLLTSRFTNGYLFGILSSVAGVLCVNYIFTFPFFEFNMTMAGYPITIISMLTVSVITSTMTTQIKQQETLKATAEKEKMRSDLLRAISHDLRTPLTSIAGMSDMLMEDEQKFSPEERLEIHKEIREDASWLIRMVENLLSVTRIDGAKVEVVKTPTVLDELIDSVLMKFSKKHPNQKVITQIPEEFVDIPMDSLLIEQVLLNLLENAVFHAKGMTELTLSVSLVGDKAVFEVADNGCGIPDDALQKIFTGSYEKSAAPVDGTRSNMGIGLSVCAAIVKAHGSEITAENRKGGGAVFRFALERGGEDDGQ